MTVLSATHAQSHPDSQTLLIMAAGSLTQAMNDIIDAYEKQGGKRFMTQYAPSGKLRQEIEDGKRVAVFASASAEHTEALAAKKLLGDSRVFTHNNLCVLAREELGLEEGNLFEVLSRQDVRVATSTPVSDPMGDYTWQFFRKADRQKPGLYQLLNNKALKLSGTISIAPGAKTPYVTAFEENKADAYIMYCTNAVSTKKTLHRLSIVPIPDKLNINGDYGIAAHPGSEEGKRFVDFVMQSEAQSILRKHGFR